MKFYELVAALVLRVGVNNKNDQIFRRGATWSELGFIFGITKDAARHQLNRFKEKYNIVDSDLDDFDWLENFYQEHLPEAEAQEIRSCGITPPGSILEVNNQDMVVINPYGQGAWLHDGEDDYKRTGTGFILFQDSLAEDESNQQVISSVAIEPLKFLITPAVLVVVRDNQPLTIDKSHKNFEKIQKSLETQDWQGALDFIDMKNTLTKYSNGRVKVEGGQVTLDGENVHGKIVDRLVNGLLTENLKVLEALSNFLDKCDENPDHRVVTRIYDFIAHNDLRLDKDGFILAYKVVKHNYLDKYTGTMDNSPGKLVQMKRNKVNPRDNETCSFGLHVAAKKYIPSYGSPSTSQFGDRVVLCKVNPKDFVSIPTDYNSMKARVCEYLVLKDVTELFVNKQELDDGVQA